MCVLSIYLSCLAPLLSFVPGRFITNPNPKSVCFACWSTAFDRYAGPHQSLYLIMGEVLGHRYFGAIPSPRFTLPLSCEVRSTHLLIQTSTFLYHLCFLCIPSFPTPYLTPYSSPIWASLAKPFSSSPPASRWVSILFPVFQSQASLLRLEIPL